MEYITKGEPTAALRKMPLWLFSSTTEQPISGVTVALGELLISKNGGAEANATNAFTEIGTSGVYEYQCSVTEVDTVGDLCLRINKSGIMPTVNIVSVRDDIFAGSIDTYTPNKAMSLMLAALAGKVSGASSNAPVFRSADDSANRITATTDANGNRTAVTLNPQS